MLPVKHTHTHTHACTHVHVHAHMHAHTQTRTHTQTHAHRHMRTLSHSGATSWMFLLFRSRLAITQQPTPRAVHKTLLLSRCSHMLTELRWTEQRRGQRSQIPCASKVQTHVAERLTTANSESYAKDKSCQTPP